MRAHSLVAASGMLALAIGGGCKRERGTREERPAPDRALQAKAASELFQERLRQVKPQTAVAEALKIATPLMSATIKTDAGDLRQSAFEEVLLEQGFATEKKFKDGRQIEVVTSAGIALMVVWSMTHLKPLPWKDADPQRRETDTFRAAANIDTERGKLVCATVMFDAFAKWTTPHGTFHDTAAHWLGQDARMFVAGAIDGSSASYPRMCGYVVDVEEASRGKRVVRLVGTVAKAP